MGTTKQNNSTEVDLDKVPFLEDGNGEYQLSQVLEMLAECELTLINLGKRCKFSDIDNIDIRAMRFGIKYALDAGMVLFGRERV